MLAVDLAALGSSQGATVGCAIVVDFVVDRSFAAFKPGGFAGGQLAALDALRDAVLLVLLALADFTFWVGILYRRIVLVLVGLLG